MERSAGLILYRKREGTLQYLLLKYKYTSNYWGLCKGNIEKDEEEKAAALREAEEETNLKEITIHPHFKETTRYYLTRDNQKIQKEVVWFLGEVFDKKDGEVSFEHEALTWAYFEEAHTLLTYPKDKEVLKKAHILVCKK